MGRVPCLDGLRGFAVILVLLSHLDVYGTTVLPGLHMAGAGFYGVTLFFTLSAYLLTSLLLRRGREQLRTTAVWREYFLRRFFRIYPLYTAVLLAGVAASALGADFTDVSTTADVLDHLMLRKGVGVFWTIPVEVHFYLLLPVLVLIATSPLLPNRAFATIAAALFLTAVLAVPSESRMALSRNLPAFLAGAYAAWAHPWLESGLGEPDSRARQFVEVAGWLALLAVAMHVPVVVSWWNDAVVAVDRFHDEPGRFGALWSVVLLAAVHGSGQLRRLLSATPLRLLGVISFSVYLVHLPVLRLFDSRLPESPAAAAWATILVTVALATVTYATIERPFLVMGRPRKRLLPDDAATAA